MSEKNSTKNANANTRGGGAKNNRPRRNNKRYRGPRKRGAYKGPGQSDVVVKYQNLLEQHLQSRKKYYDLYHRADPNQKAKLERNFERTIKQLRDFESNLRPEQKKSLETLTEGFDKDYTYAHNHELPEETSYEELGEINIQDPHFLESQKDHGYSDDNEESMGSMDDYFKYKGIDPPVLKDRID